MRSVYKYPLDSYGATSVELPAGAVILSVQPQRGAPCLWALVDPAAPTESRELYVAGTGHDLPGAAGDWRFVGTFQTGGEMFVFHVFEVTP